MSIHPAIAVYEQTERHDFPLILVFGREPNSPHHKSKGVGRYDFNTSKRCAFWNIAYRTVGKSASKPVTSQEMKRICHSAKGSPIVFADALPIGLEDKEKSKYRRRLAVSDADVTDHILEIFSHQKILDRTAIILLSGVEGTEFSRSLEQIEHEASARKIPSLRVLFSMETTLKKSKHRWRPLMQFAFSKLSIAS
jgi:hypothetical protein